jgi:serine protease Do
LNAKLIERRDAEIAVTIDPFDKVEVQKEYDSQIITHGLKAGDIITRADKTVFKTDFDWTLFIRNIRAGQLVMFTVIREKHEMQIPITIGEVDEETDKCKHYVKPTDKPTTTKMGSMGKSKSTK